MHSDTPQPTRGAVTTMLRLYVQCNCASLHDFAKRAGVERTKLARILSGRTRKVDVDTAVRIETATGGAIAAGSWQ